MVTLDEGGWLGHDAVVTPWAPGMSDVIEHTFLLPMAAASHTDWTVVPDASTHLIVHRTDGSGGPATSPVLVVGARGTATRIDVGSRRWTVGVRLRPGALPLLSGLPAGDFTDRATPAFDVWGRSAERMCDSAADAADPTSMLQALVSFLLSSPGASKDRDWKARALTECFESAGAPALDAASPVQAASHLSASSRFRVGATADRLGMSVRALRSASRDLIGLAPKRVARVHRLQAAIAMGAGVATPSWSRIAIQTGFADQAHLVREYRDLLRDTPSRYHGRGRTATSCRFVQSRTADST